MKRIRRILWALVIVAVLVIVLALVFIRPVDYTPYFLKPYYKETMKNLHGVDAALPQIHPAPVQVGFGKASVTPPVGTPLAGYGDRHGEPSVGVHDSLFARTFAVKAGDQEFVLVTGDFLLVPIQLADSVMARIEPALGLTRKQILFSATHTHSGPGAWGKPGLKKNLPESMIRKSFVFWPINCRKPLRRLTTI